MAALRKMDQAWLCSVDLAELRQGLWREMLR